MVVCGKIVSTMTNSQYPRLSIRISHDLVCRLDDISKVRDVSKSKLVRQALMQFLMQLEVRDDAGRLSNNS
jgi:predicted transcriptional regulator